MGGHDAGPTSADPNPDRQAARRPGSTTSGPCGRRQRVHPQRTGGPARSAASTTRGRGRELTWGRSGSGRLEPRRGGGRRRPRGSGRRRGWRRCAGHRVTLHEQAEHLGGTATHLDAARLEARASPYRPSGSSGSSNGCRCASGPGTGWNPRRIWTGRRWCGAGVRSPDPVRSRWKGRRSTVSASAPPTTSLDADPGTGGAPRWYGTGPVAVPRCPRPSIWPWPVGVGAWVGGGPLVTPSMAVADDVDITNRVPTLSPALRARGDDAAEFRRRPASTRKASW